MFVFNGEPWMARPTIANSNPVDFNYYPFMISLDKRNASCNLVFDLSTKTCFSNKTRNVITITCD